MKEVLFALAIDKHRKWGFIITPFILTKDTNNNWNCSYILTHDENDNNFRRLSEEEKQIIHYVEEYDEKRLFKLFSKDRNIKEFLEKVTDERIEKFIRPYIEKRIALILNLANITEARFFIRNKSTARVFAEDFIILDSNPVEPVFHFSRTRDGTVYSLKLKDNENIISLKDQSVDVLCDFPAYIRYKNRIIHIRAIEARKINPFLSKDDIYIPPKTELKYFNGFIKTVIRDFEVNADGFLINNITPDKQAILSLERGLDSRVTLVLVFIYERTKILANSGVTVFVDFSNDNGVFSFNRYSRDYSFEQDYRNFLESRKLISRDRVNYYLHEVMNNCPDEQDFSLIEWINRHIGEIKEKGFIFKQNISGITYFTGETELIFNPVLINDWFDIHAFIKAGNFEIPFINLRKHILNGERQYVLPDNEIFIIPGEWLTRYREIMEFGKPDHRNLRLHKQHFPFIKKATGDEKEHIPDELEKLGNFGQNENAGLPESFNGTLRPYQLEGFTWLLYLQQNSLGGCIADDMGLGKTVQTISVLLKSREEMKQKQVNNNNIPSEQLTLFAEEAPSLTSLIVVPASLVYNWVMEFRKFAPVLRVYSYFGNQRIKDPAVIHKYDIIISSYHTVRQDIELLSGYNFFYVILDESQIIKNSGSKLYEAVNLLSAQHKLVLTGTPVENSLTDLWAQMNFINPGLLGNLNFFRNKYVYPVEKRGEKAAEERLKEIIRPYILRRTKVEVASDLPEIDSQVVFCSMTEEQRKYYEEEKSSIRNLVLEEIEKTGIEKSSIIVLQGLTRLRQIANHPMLTDPGYPFESGKYNEVIRNIGNIVSEGHKLLVFSSFVKNLELYEPEMKQHGITYVMLTGSSIHREDIVKAFQENNDCKVFLISLKAGGLGLNLTAADYVFILDPWWNPAAEQQALSRAHRIGQHNNVFVYRFITENSIEEKIHLLQRRKNKLAETFITSNNPMKDMSRKDVEELFE